MTKDRWILAATGQEEGHGAATHSLMELEHKTGVYLAIADVFSLGTGRLLIEALCWQEALENGVVVPPPAAVLSVSKQVQRSSRVRKSSNSRVTK